MDFLKVLQKFVLKKKLVSFNLHMFWNYNEVFTALY